MPKTVCVDFDGVLNLYTGWQGENELFEPRPGVGGFLSYLRNDLGYRVVIHTTREAGAVWSWLIQHMLGTYITDVTSVKPPAEAYIDDRGICFRGDYEATLQELEHFKPHWQTWGV